jgi:actin-related protein
VALHDLEDGAGEGQQQPMESTNEMYQQYANAPKSSYKLPDGTIVDISQTKRFDVSELLFGKAGKSARTRQEAVEEAKKRLDCMISEASEKSGVESSQGGGGEGGSIGTGKETVSSEMDAIIQMEEMTKRKRTARGLGGDTPKKKVSSLASHQSLMRACAPYLQNSIGEFTASTLPSMICESAFLCDREQQSQLLGNAILCGGGACLATSVLSSSNVATANDGNAMPERIQLECEAILQAQTPGWKVKVLSPGIAERSICSWLGASILGSLGSFHEMWVTKAEYEEYGSAIVHRKCP